jgi:hypothetical protein
MAMPSTYSISRTEVHITLRRFLDHVSSMNPVATETWVWKSRLFSMIPARRYGAAARLASFSRAT